MYLLLRFFVNQPAAVEPMKIVIDEDMWRLPCNRAPPRKHSEEKQKEIRNQVDELLELGVIKESKATEWSQVHLVPKPTPEGQPQKWRFHCSIELSHWWTRRMAHSQHPPDYQSHRDSET